MNTLKINQFRFGNFRNALPPFVAILFCIFQASAFSMDFSFEEDWQAFEFSYERQNIVLKLPKSPEVWETDDGRLWIKCEESSAIYLAMFQETSQNTLNTRLIRKYVRETPPFEGFVCVEFILFPANNKIIVDTTWHSLPGEREEPWNIVKERSVFTSRGIYTFYTVYVRETETPPYPFYFNSIKLLKRL